MKKALSFLIIVSLCLSMLMMVTSCSSKHPIEEFKEKMEKADSYQMSITMSDVPFLGTFTMTTKVDGNIQYTPAVMFNEEEYTETVGDVEYKYTKDDSGKWTKTKVEDTEDDSSSIYGDDSLNKLFNPDNYEKVKGEENTYKQKDDVDFEDYENVKITIEDDSCTIEMSFISNGITVGVKIAISKIGEIELTLPKVGWVQYINTERI